MNGPWGQRVSEKRPSKPSAKTLAALAEADARPGAFFPLTKLSSRSTQAYYREQYPDYVFTWRSGVLYVMKEAG